MVSQDRILILFNYDSKTGQLTRKIGRGGRLKGAIAGTKDSYGYLQCAVDGKLYLVHRLIWLYMYGQFPTEEVDHIDFDRTNNRIDNLRLASRAKNMHNLAGARSDSLTGAKGVSFKKGKYIARIQRFGTRLYLGAFTSKELAQLAYESAATNGVFQAT